MSTRELKIARAGSRFDTYWDNQLTNWDSLTKYLADPRISHTTVAQYHSLPKAKRDDVKDVGGFVGGHLKHGRRRKGHILSRSLIALDLDTPPVGLVDQLPSVLPVEWVVYSTCSHTPEQPRLRLIIPLVKDVTADEYGAVARRIAADIGIDYFDDTTYEPHRLMYGPAHPIDGEFLYRHNTGPWLSPDEVLARFDDWQDMSTWPTSSRHTTRLQETVGKQADPLTKPGLVGAFCRTYTITQAIETFLPEVYAPTKTEGRYTYTAGESTGGAVIYNNQFLYSHHSTDPVSMQLVNAFDLVRIHLWGSWDEEAKDGTPTHKLPSTKQMVELARTDPKVKTLLDAEAEAQAQAEFTDNPDIASGGEPTPGGEPAVSWRTKAGLERNHRGGYDDSLENLTKIITYDPRLQAIRYNQLTETITTATTTGEGGLPWVQQKPGVWTDADIAQLKLYIEKNFGIYQGTKTLEALHIAATTRHYHPIRDYLAGLPAWDGTQRIDTLLIDYLGAENTGYVRAVTRKTLIAAVARVMRPGIKFDQVLILNGPQGTGKSTLFAKLAGDWFSDALTLTDMRDKTGAEKLQGYWILELGELAGMRKMEVETVKGFLSRTDDKFRAAYARTVEAHPRQCIIVGSTNAENGFLRDVTGNRRFLPVTVTGGGNRHTWDLGGDTIAQIWAEALAAFKAGEPLFLTGRVAQDAARAQDAALETDERVGLVEQYLDTPLPAGWWGWGVRERRAYLTSGGEDFSGVEGGFTGACDAPALERRMRVSNAEVWAECFGRDPSDMKPADAYAVAAIMRSLPGWEKTGKRERVFPYGRQRLYERTAEEQPPF